MSDTVRPNDSSVINRREVIKANYDSLKRWPYTGVWSGRVVGERPENGYNRIKKMSMYDIIEQIGTVPSPYTKHDYRDLTVWQFTDMARSLLDEIGEDRRRQLPCGDVGFTNTGEWIQCNKCNARFTKEEVKEYNR